MALPQLEIRPATCEDASAIASVRSAATAILRQTYRPRTATRPVGPELRWIVALVDGQIVGLSGYQLHPGRLHIIGLGVLPEFQRRGISRRLVDYLAQMAIRQRLLKLSLYTVRETGNCQIFEKLGFAAVSERIADGDESERFAILHDVYMERTL